MFDAILAKWSVRPKTVVIPLDRPDLMADAGFDGARYQGPALRVRVRRDLPAATWLAFHAVAG